jgi:hypothetical protein
LVPHAEVQSRPAARAVDVGYRPRQPQRTALYQVMQAHLGTFLQSWQGDAEGHGLPRHVTGELQEFLTCGIAQHGFAHLYCDRCQCRHVVPFCCKGRGFCPSCGGRRMNEGAANLVDHVLPEGVAVRQWVLTLPFPLRFALAFDAALLGAVHRLFTDTVAAFYRKRRAGECGGLTVIQRASSDLRCNPHFHTLFLDGVYERNEPQAPPTFAPAPPPTQAEVELVVQTAARRIVRFLQRRGLIAVATAPGDGEATVSIADESLGDADPLLGRLLAAAIAGLPPAGPATKRAPVRLALAPHAPTVAKGRLCAEHWGFNLVQLKKKLEPGSECRPPQATSASSDCKPPAPPAHGSHNPIGAPSKDHLRTQADRSC